jgi:diguanylate cyclase (GGDEF)-like protein/PAS domain S-box-containing protein
MIALIAPVSPVLTDLGPVFILALILALVLWRLRLSKDATLARKGYESLFRYGDPVASLDAHGSIDRVNPAFCQLSKYQEEEVEGVSFVSLVAAADRGPVGAALTDAFAGEPHKVETELLAKDGQNIAIELTTVPIIVSERTVGAYQIVRNITLQKELEHQLTRALHDHLTGVANRDLFSDRLEHALQRAARHGGLVGLLYLDLDGFKSINDRAGHPAGDEVLREAATRLRSLLRDEDTVARVGGDEFAVLLEDVQDADGAVAVAERAAELLSHPFRSNGRSFDISASVGLAVSSPDTSGPEDLVRQADVAMYEAKRQGGNRHRVFTQELEAARSRSLRHLEGDLLRAIERQELYVHYQPVVDIAGSQIVGVEALARWQHPQHGVVSPNHFIPLAEDSGVIAQVDLRVLEQACRDMRHLAKIGAIGSRGFTLTVNLSANHLADDSLVENIGRILEAERFPAGNLKLDVSEDAIRGSAKQIADLKSLGVRVTIHDFGTGYTSLGYLKQVDVDGLKVDRSFVLPIGVDQASAAIVRSSLWLAQLLGLEITVVGVEAPTQLERLRELGGRLVQGFYFSEPVGVKELERLLREGVPQAWIWRPGPELRRKAASA